MKKVILDLINELQKMANEDQRIRKNADKNGNWDFNIDKENTKKLEQIIKIYGWPTIKLVGKKASRNAWLIVQHADKNREFQKNCLKLMKKLAKENPQNIDKQNIAFLTDRLLTVEGKKQIFGTQFYTNKKGILNIYPIKNSKNVNSRRREYNIWPIEKDLKEMDEFNKKPTN